MMMKPYPDYKDSGVAWLGQIPAHWDALQNRALFKERITKGRIDEELLSVTMKEGIIKQKELLSESSKKDSSNEDKSNYKLVMPDDLAYNKMRMWQGAVGASKFQGIVSPAYVVIQPKSDVNSWYYHYLFRIPAYTNESYRHSYGICDDQLSLRYEDFKVMSSPKPPIEEQHKIVRFLDEKCEKIDRFIANKQRMAALLREQKQAVISAAVTGKLNACVSCAPCGSCVKSLNANDANGARDAKAWFGDIPSHWEVRRLKMIADIRYGLGQPPQELSSGIRMIRATNVDHGKILEKDMLYVDPKEIPIERNPFLKEDEIIVVRSGAYTADSAIIPQQYAGSIAGYDMVVTVTKAYPKFIASALLSKYVLDDQLFLLRLRAAQPHINAEELGNTLILLPSIEEQKKIALFVSETSRKIETIIARIEREIDLMQEYRARLIADVVTGQIDVREKI